MQLHNQPDDHKLDRALDAALASYPNDPLPAGFTQSVMASIAQESLAQQRKEDPTSLLAHISRKNLLWLGGMLYQELISIRQQVRMADVRIAALFALLWFVVAGSFIWTQRLVSEQLVVQQADQWVWLLPVCLVTGGFLALGMIGLFFYVEQRDI